MKAKHELVRKKNSNSGRKKFYDLSTTFQNLNWKCANTRLFIPFQIWTEFLKRHKRVFQNLNYVMEKRTYNEKFSEVSTWGILGQWVSIGILVFKIFRMILLDIHESIWILSIIHQNKNLPTSEIRRNVHYGVPLFCSVGCLEYLLHLLRRHM